MTKISVSVHVGEVDVDVDLSNFDSDDLRDELRNRLIEAPDMDGMLKEMFYAFKLGCDDKAIQLARRIAEEHVGGIL
jgi:hypothetical protein